MTATDAPRAQASLNRRLMLGAGVFIALALVIATVMIGFVLHRFVQGQIDQRLDTQIVFLASTARAGSDGTLSLNGDADGPPFDRAGRGWYWQMTGPANVIRSRSLGSGRLNVPDRPRPPPHDERRPRRDDRPEPGDGPGPGNERLHFRTLAVTVGATPVTITASAPRGAVFGPLREAMTTLALSLAALGLALVFAIVLQVRLGLRPLERLRQSVSDVRAGRRARVPAEQPQEIAPLAGELNALLDENAANLERARRHVANLAHGLKTPLATLSIALSESGRSGAGDLHSLVVLMERRIRHHLARARAAALSSPARAQTPIAPRIDDLCGVLAKIYADKGVAFTAQISSDLAVACEPQDFDEMIGNLLDNAFRHARSSVAVSASPDAARNVALTIEDDGPGLQDDQIPQVLRPGERLDETAQGFGFGLPITRELAELYGGELQLGTATLDNETLGGLRVTLKLPRAGITV